MSKKKVLIFIPEFPALTETFIEREVSKLVESENLDVSVFSLKKGKGRMSDLTRQHLKYPRLSVFSFVCGLFFYLSHISKISVAFNTIKNNPNRSFFGSGYLLLKSLGYSYLFSKYKPEIIFAHFMSESSTICLVASIILNVPLVISAHAKDVLQTTGSNISENAELIIEKVSHAKFVFICNKYAYAKVLEVCGKDNLPNVLLRYHGIDYVSLLKEFESVVAPSVSTDLPILFTIGRFVEKKGFTYLVDAVKSLKDSKIDFHLYIAAGSGDTFENIKNKIVKLGLSKDVTILGDGNGLSFDEILKYYKITNIFVLPSINAESGDADGVPNVLIEAAFLKIPVVTTDAGGILDFVEDKTSGVIVEQKNPQQLADAISQVLKNKKLQNTLTENAYENAVKMFDLNKNIKEIERLLV